MEINEDILDRLTLAIEAVSNVAIAVESEQPFRTSDLLEAVETLVSIHAELAYQPDRLCGMQLRQATDRLLRGKMKDC